MLIEDRTPGPKPIIARSGVDLSPSLTRRRNFRGQVALARSEKTGPTASRHTLPNERVGQALFMRAICIYSGPLFTREREREDVCKGASRHINI